MLNKVIDSVNGTKKQRIKSGKEKRKRPRLNISLRLFCYCLTSRIYFFSSCENISPGGMGLSGNGSLKLNELMEFKIEFPGRIISCKGKIISIKYLSDSEDWKARVRFTNLESKDREFITNFILEMNLRSIDKKI